MGANLKPKRLASCIQPKRFNRQRPVPQVTKSVSLYPRRVAACCDDGGPSLKSYCARAGNSRVDANPDSESFPEEFRSA